MSEYTYSGDSYDVYSSLSFAYQAYATSSSDSGDGYSYAKDALSDEEGNVEDVITEEPQVSKDWNAEFQEILSVESGMRKYQKLSALASDFVYAAQSYGKIIISESSLPVERKTIKPVAIGGVAFVPKDTHPSGGEKYIVMNILFKFALDVGGLYGSDEAAMKSASNELKGLMSYYNCQVPSLCFPLMALIDYRGYRLVAMSVLPISKDSIIYGSHDAGATVYATDEEFNLKMRQSAKILNLKPHSVGRGSQAKVLHSCGDIEGHRGTDGRTYLLDFARVFPPQVIFQKDRLRRHLFEMLRPELVASHSTPLSSDALTAWGSHDPDYKVHNQEVHVATANLIEKIIPEVATNIDKMSEAELRKLRLIEEIHRNGINVRHLGFLRSHLTSKPARDLLLVECIARIVKASINEKLREKVRLLKIPSEEPYRRVVLRYLNKFLRLRKKFWKILKHQVICKFVGCLNAEEMAPKFKLHSSISMYELITRLQSLMGIVISREALAELQNNELLRLVDPDLVNIEATVKSMNLIEHSSGVVLAFEAMESKGKEAERLFRLADEKFQRSLERTPNSTLTLYDWSKMLHSLALRYVGNLDLDYVGATSNPQKQVAATTPTGVSADEAFLAAEEKLRRALAINPDHVECKSALAELLFDYATFIIQNQDFKKHAPALAQDKFSESLGMDPSRAGVLKQRAMAAYRTFLDNPAFVSVVRSFSAAAAMYQALLKRPDTASSKLHYDLFLLIFKYISFRTRRQRSERESLALERLPEMAASQLSFAFTNAPEHVHNFETMLALSSTPHDLVALQTIVQGLDLSSSLKTRISTISTLNFIGMKFTSEAAIMQLISSASLLQYLCLDGCTQITDSLMKFLARAPSRLVSISLRDCKQLTTGPLMDSIESLAVLPESIVGLGDASSISTKSNLLSPPNPTSAPIDDSLFGALAGSTSFSTSFSSVLKSTAATPAAASGKQTISGLKKAASLGLAAVSSMTSKLADSLIALDMTHCASLEGRNFAEWGLVFKKLESVNVSRCSKIVDENLIRFISTAKGLKELGIAECFQLTTPSIAAISKLESLTSLSVAGMRGVELSAISSALKNCSALHTVDLVSWKDLSDDVMKSLASNKTPLRSIVLSHCDSLTDSTFSALAKKLTSSLHKISLSGCTKIRDSTVELIASSCPNISYANFSGCTGLASKSVKALAKHCAKLKELDISGCTGITEGIHLLFNQCPNLKTFSCSGCIAIPADQEVSLMTTNHPRCRLEKLDWADSLLRQESILTLVDKLPSLTSLDVSKSHWINDAAFQSIGKFPNLIRLVADSLSISDSAVQAFSKTALCKNINSLSFADCHKLTDASLAAIADNFPLLEFIRMERWRITANGLKYLCESCGDLIEAYINNCVGLDVPDIKATIRSEFPRLKALIS